MRKRYQVWMAAALGFMAAQFAAQAEPSRAPLPEPPLLLELFTSQGCSSCPLAERLFASLADDPAYVTIEWHVDYWDRLVHGGTKWRDPFSSPAFTARQRAYNQALRGTPSVYTPQAILAGEHEFVGSRPKELSAARQAAEKPAVTLASFSGRVAVSGTGAGEVIFVRLLDRHETKVKGGENAGRMLAGRHIALDMKSLGDWRGQEATYDIPTLQAGETCALFVQSAAGPVMGAAYCAAD